MADRAKLFKSGGCQAVRLPKGYRFEGQSEVRIYRHGRKVILDPPCAPPAGRSFRFHGYG